MNKQKQQICVGFISLGCPKNVVDSERMLAEIAQAGFLISAEPDNSDVILINTCAFIAPAKEESLDAIREAVNWKKNSQRTIKKVIVAGCLSERTGSQLLDEIKGIDAIIGLGNRDNIARIIEETLTSDESKVYLDQTSTNKDQKIHDDRARLLINSSHWVYLRISEGCNRKCSFCTIPSIRGRFRSKPPEMVLAEAEELAVSGIVELNIIAQDTTYYGKDLKIQSGLAYLINKLENINNLDWIRLMYLYPGGIDEKLIKTITKSKKVVHYMDIPIQHINNWILSSMRRPDTKEQIKQLIDKLRTEIHDIVLRTTVIVGYPGETDEQFNELLDFIQWAQFDALGGFKYYPESGTEAAKMTDQVPDKIKKQRLEELMLCQQEIVFKKNQNRIGSRISCMINSIENEHKAHGRFYGQAPEIDGICIVKTNNKRKQKLRSGQFIDVKVVDYQNYDLIVEPI